MQVIAWHRDARRRIVKLACFGGPGGEKEIAEKGGELQKGGKGNNK